MAEPRRAGGASRLPRRLAALGLGLLLCGAALELGLAGAWRAFAWSAARDNAGAPGARLIVCLGESTTAVAGDPQGRMLVPATAWPAQLEARLNARSDGPAYVVLNDGVMGGDSVAAVDLLERTLAEQRPQVIIAMMGIKDLPAEARARPAWRRLRLVRLWAWLEEGRRLRATAAVTDLQRFSELPAAVQAMGEGFNTFVFELGLAGQAAALDRVKAAIYLWKIGRLSAAEQRLRAVVAEQQRGYSALAQVLQSAGRSEEAQATLDAAVAARPRDGSFRALQVSLALEAGRPDQAERALALGRAALGAVDEPRLVENLLNAGAAELALARQDWAGALVALDGLSPAGDRRYAAVMPPLRLRAKVLRGRALIGQQDWATAERVLTEALEVDARGESVLWLLAQVYRATGQTAREEEVRRSLLPASGRMADVFELAKLYRLTGRGAEVPALLDQAARQIPSLETSYARLYDLAERVGARVVVMQYPSFPLEVIRRYAPAAPGVRFVDNQRLFDADPDRALFEPSFPVSFSHYTHEGAGLLAAQAEQAVRALEE